MGWLCALTKATGQQARLYEIVSLISSMDKPLHLVIAKVAERSEFDFRSSLIFFRSFFNHVG